MRKALVALIVLAVCGLSGTSDAADARDRPITSREVLITLKNLANSVKDALKAAKNLDRHMSTTRSLVDLSAIKSIDWDTQKLNRLIPEPLPPINTIESIRRIALAGEPSKDTLIGSQEQVRRLHAAADDRQKEIDALVRTREELAELKKSYGEISTRLADHGAKLEKLATDAVIEATALFGGTNFLLSVIDFEEFVVKGAERREQAAERAVRRYDKVIKAAREDLAAYKEALTFADLLISGLPPLGPAAELDSDYVPGESTVELQRIKTSMEQGTAETQRIASELRQEAAKIRAHNAQLNKIQGLLSAMSSAASLAGAIDASTSPAPGAGDSATTYNIQFNTEMNVWQTVVAPTVILSPPQSITSPDTAPIVPVPPPE